MTFAVESWSSSIVLAELRGMSRARRQSAARSVHIEELEEKWCDVEQLRIVRRLGAGLLTKPEALSRLWSMWSYMLGDLFLNRTAHANMHVKILDEPLHPRV